MCNNVEKLQNIPAGYLIEITISIVHLLAHKIKRKSAKIRIRRFQIDSQSDMWNFVIIKCGIKGEIFIKYLQEIQTN